ncbi:MAG: C10 family peptidase [Bacteroidota bacterium]
MRIFLFSAAGFILWFIIPLKLTAAPVDLKKASLVAKNFYTAHHNLLTKTQGAFSIKGMHYEVKDSENQLLYYVFNFNPIGFIAVAGDDNSVPVLAYSFASDYSPVDQNPAFTFWMKRYSDQLHEIRNEKLQATDQITSQWETYSQNEIPILTNTRSITPMLTSTWNQGIYYNGACPVDPAGPGGRAYAGCVATAMGQLMYFYRWPETGLGSYSYTHATYGTISADFSATTYRWNEMTNSLMENNAAVAEMLFHCGVAVDMVYGPSGSGMYNHHAALALRDYFKYQPSTQYVFRDSVTYNWDSLLTTNLDQKRPMYYAGWAAGQVGTNGHAFVCDGYQGTGYYHFNWGWGGSYDGYFYTNNLNPSGYNFNYGQEVIPDMFPDTSLYTFPLYCGNDTLTATTGSMTDGSSIENYLPNADCRWLIQPTANISNLTFTFSYMNLAAGDTVYVYNGVDASAVLLGKYSGSTLPASFSSTSDVAFVKFVSDAALESNGFFMTYKSVYPVYCSALTNVIAATDTISDGSGVNVYNANSNCRWLINPGLGSVSVKLEFLEFDIADDMMKVYDPTTVPSTLLGTYSGNTLPPSIYANNGQMLIAFTSNATNHAQGWKVVYSTNYGVNEILSEQTIQIAPNPVADFTFIHFSISNEDFQIEMYNTTGQKMNCDLLKLDNKTIRVNTSALPQGIYFLSIRNQKMNAFKKIVRQ